MKQQDIFNKAAVHLTGMEGPSLDQDNDACAYRGKDEDCEFNGQMCAVGLFIADEHYDDDLEGQSISGGQVVNAVAASWGQDDLTVEQLDLLTDLQNAHDQGSRCEDWYDQIVWALERVAKKHGLEVSA